MGTFVADYNATMETAGVTFQNGFTPIEFQNTVSKQRVGTSVVVTLSSPSALVGGALLITGWDELTQAWVGVPQKVCVIASGGGTPGVVNGNTASATAVVGGVVENTTGVTAITSTITVMFYVPPIGMRLRLDGSVTSGSATLKFYETGLTAF